MIVVDANTLAYFVISGPLTIFSQQVRKKDHVWVTPYLTRYELLSVVAKYLDRNLLTRDQALALFRRAMSCVSVMEQDPEVLDILLLHQLSGCTTYDCAFISAARSLHCKLVTVDRELLTQFPNDAVHPQNF